MKCGNKAMPDQTIRRKAMSKRVPIEEMALAIINANEVLNSPTKLR